MNHEQHDDHPRADATSIDSLESMARQNCYTGIADKDYNGQVKGTKVTDSGALSANADALRTLAEHGRFRVVAEYGRMVVGYWPENEPKASTAELSRWGQENQ